MMRSIALVCGRGVHGKIGRALQELAAVIREPIIALIAKLWELVRVIGRSGLPRKRRRFE
jgi:hypothetical protein